MCELWSRARNGLVSVCTWVHQIDAWVFLLLSSIDNDRSDGELIESATAPYYEAATPRSLLRPLPWPVPYALTLTGAGTDCFPHAVTNGLHSL